MAASAQVSSTMANGLPPLVFLYIRLRKGDKRFILMNTAYNHHEANVTLTMATTAEHFRYVTPPPDFSTGEYLGQFSIVSSTGVILKKAIRKHPAIAITSNTTGLVMVISVTDHTTVFGSHTLKQNVCFLPADAATAATTVSLIPNPNVISHASSIVVKKKGDQLCPFVAKKLMTLAIIQKEQCPITVEDFSEGNTAVMPCGHLFMQSALEETFKTEPAKCPWCRQTGRPTYV
jgi:hypothetical protein